MCMAVQVLDFVQWMLQVLESSVEVKDLMSVHGKVLCASGKRAGATADPQEV